MPTADPSNVLFQIAHPDLYERNPFNVLNLPVNATAKEIRRRREDIEAAFDAGTEADEFRSVLPADETRETPTRDTVASLFAALDDPQKRIAYALFWYWPDDLAASGSASRRRNPDPNEVYMHWDTIEDWEKRSSDPAIDPISRAIIRHNLAVFHHMMGLAYELMLESIPDPAAETPDDVQEHWRAAIARWNESADDAEFWRQVASLVEAMGDARIDYRFARSLRDQFAFAFDQINVELAIGFAKRGCESDAKRQLEYMRLSQPDADDVEGTFDDAFTGLLRQVEAICKSSDAESKKNPKDGLHQAKLILAQTEEPLRISRVIFPQGNRIRNAIVTAIFLAVRNCLIDYGNITKDWDGCLKLTATLKTLAENDDQAAMVAKDEKIIDGNMQRQVEEEICWFCKKKFGPTRQRQITTVQLWGDMRPAASVGQVAFSKMSVDVPVCVNCQNLNHETHPKVEEWLDKGWKIGSGPSQSEIRKFLGWPDVPPVRRSASQPSGCSPFASQIIGILLIMFIGWILSWLGCIS